MVDNPLTDQARSALVALNRAKPRSMFIPAAVQRLEQDLLVRTVVRRGVEYLELTAAGEERRAEVLAAEGQ